MEYKDYYKVLGVDRDASQEEIKNVYRKLTRKYHPDVSKEPDAEAKAKAINEAYDVLGDPEKRRAYDEMGQNWQSYGQYQDINMSFREVLEKIFRERAERQRTAQGRATGQFSSGGGDFADFMNFGNYSKAREAQPLRETEFSLEIDLEDSFFGRNKTLTFMDKGQRRELNVKIPKGIREGQKIRLNNQDGQAILLEVHFRPHPRFRLEDRDLHLDLPLAPWEAALGDKITVETLGDSVEVKIPRGSQSGKKVRLKGLGLPGSSKAEAGDLYLHLKIVTPPATTAKAEAYYQEMKAFFSDFSAR
jgi:curved DNA-binding protein